MSSNPESLSTRLDSTTSIVDWATADYIVGQSRLRCRFGLTPLQIRLRRVRVGVDYSRPAEQTTPEQIRP
eukprot:5973491-Lingulodinium_polyedra.AAC.1